jgi:hypothetical protein
MAAAADARITPVFSGADGCGVPPAPLPDAVELPELAEVVVREVDKIVVDADVDVPEEVVDDAVVEALVLEEVVEEEVVVVELLEGAKVAVSLPGPFATKLVEGADRFVRAMLPELETHPEK